MAKSKPQVRQPKDISQLGTILSVWAHPDDETFCCGGLMSWAANNGQRVVCVTATCGEAGSQDPDKWPLEKLGEVRRQEMAEALKIFGIAEHHWLDYPDGGCDGVDEALAVNRITKLITEIKPDTILTFGREGLTGHPDHQAVCRWTHAALNSSQHTARVYHPVVEKQHYHSHFKQADQKLDIFFAIDQPPIADADSCSIALSLPPELLRTKRAALAAMPSQTEIMLATFDEDFLNETWSMECLMCCSA